MWTSQSSEPANGGWMQLISQDTIVYLALMAAAFVTIIFFNNVYFGPWFHNKCKALENNLEEQEKQLLLKEKTLELVSQALIIAMKEEESMTNALYASEMRHRAKTTRPSRTERVGSRSPELLPNLTAERCREGGVAMLQIKDEDDDKSSQASWKSRRSRRQERGPEDGAARSERNDDRPTCPGKEAGSNWEHVSLESCVVTVR